MPSASVLLRFNLAEYVLSAGGETAEKAALVIARRGGAETWSFGEISAAVAGIGAGLQALGLPQGARVLMRLGNDVSFPLTYLGAIWGGFVPVPTSAALTATEITPICAQAAPAVIVASEGVALPEGAPCPVVREAEVMAMARGAGCAPVRGDAERAGYIVFTSGTSGRPRGIVHAHRAILARRMMAEGWYGLRGGDRMLHAGAFNWTYTLGTGLMDPWTHGATAIVPAAGTAPQDLPALIAGHEATLFAAAPGVFRQILSRAEPLPAPALRHALSAGEALPEAVREGWRARYGTEVYEALGMSEVSTFVSGAPSRPAPLGAVGYAQAGRRIAVLGPEGAQEGAATGVLAVHRSDPGLMLGYLDDPAATRAAFKGDWFVTGDHVSRAEDGAIRYLGRGDDMLNAGGYRLSPLEIEGAMMLHPAVTACAAVAQEVRPGVQIIALAYTAAKPVEEAALRAHAAGHLAAYKVPRAYYPLPLLPMAGNGKINRKALRLSGALPLGTDKEGPNP
ncbi:acyl--CoA ligase [Alphaproteobacteria bacterium KMM 3653]|uniref:Acyl--CoA ligase n=1 Tax=Harenicola maris TaxID=2841044 RepID=A0AAP2CNN9_9RHOB|nr:acyl--CoA ligase [Harenicola maris]